MSTRDEQLRDASFGELAKSLSSDMSTLVRQEMELVRAEMRQKARHAGPGIGMVGVAGAFALAALGAFTAFLILVLDNWMPNWAAALVVTALWAAVAGFLFYRGKERVQEATPPVPEQAVESVKEDVEWAKDTLSPSRR